MRRFAWSASGWATEAKFTLACPNGINCECSGSLRLRFVLLWLLIVLIGSAIVFYSTRRVLRHIQEITEAASRIGEADLSSRVPTTRRNDEVSQLAITLNRMLDRIERSVHQLHTITGSLAHDLRSPLTAVRAKLEMSLTAGARDEESESIVSAIEDMDRLTEFLDKSLDVAEAKANALRLNRVAIDLDDLLRVMIDLYEPSMSEKGLRVKLCSAGWLGGLRGRRSPPSHDRQPFRQ